MHSGISSPPSREDIIEQARLDKLHAQDVANVAEHDARFKVEQQQKHNAILDASIAKALRAAWSTLATRNREYEFAWAMTDRQLADVEKELRGFEKHDPEASLARCAVLLGETIAAQRRGRLALTEPR